MAGTPVYKELINFYPVHKKNQSYLSLNNANINK